MLLIVICLYKSFLNILQDLDLNLNCQLVSVWVIFREFMILGIQTLMCSEGSVCVGYDDKISYNNRCNVTACHEDFCCLCITVVEKFILFVLPGR